MKEITLNRFHDILYKFFAGLVCFGFFMLAMDLITLLNRRNLYMFQNELHGWDNLLGILPVLLLIGFAWWLADTHKKQSMAVKWR